MTTRTNVSTHLSEDELDEVLLGEVSSDHRLHLANCPDCRATLEHFNVTVGLFNQTSIAWSEVKSNALARCLKQENTWIRLAVHAAWSCASALILIAALEAGIEVRQHSNTMAAQDGQRIILPQDDPSFQTDGANEIASDNAMLLKIDSAINVSEPSPQQEYGIKTSSASSAGNPLSSQVRD